MSDTSQPGFGSFVPGFDFLQNLAAAAAKSGSASPAQMPNMGSWVAPSLNPEELDKRITELKAVQFWLEQNARALTATIQALEVQKMTLATLSGMNVKLGEMANAFTPRTAKAGGDTQPKSAGADQARSAKPTPGKAAGTAEGLVDPMQLWGALTQQFQHIASTALKEGAQKAATAHAGAPSQPAATKKAKAVAGKPKAAARKSAGRSR